MKLDRSGCAALVLGLAGCASGPSEDDDGGGGGLDGATVALLLLVDASASMSDEASTLALQAGDLVAAFDGAGELRIGVSTVHVETTGGDTEDLDPGEAGTLVGPVITVTETDVSDTVRAQILCEATCFAEDALESDSEFECGDDPGGVVSRQYLDCLCGADAWRDHCGSGQEEPLEAALLGLCGGVASPPETCSDGTSPFTAGGHTPLLDGAEVAVVLAVTDEGDNSRRLGSGELDGTLYSDALTGVFEPTVFGVIGPAYDPEVGDGTCLQGATTWGVERLIDVTSATGGGYYPLTDPAGDCAAVGSFAPYFADLAGRAF